MVFTICSLGTRPAVFSSDVIFSLYRIKQYLPVVFVDSFLFSVAQTHLVSTAAGATSDGWPSGKQRPTSKSGGAVLSGFRPLQPTKDRCAHAADMTKKSMVALYENGIIPHIQIHDEVDISVESPEKAEQIISIMESAVELQVPNKVDYEQGENWGDIK